MAKEFNSKIELEASMDDQIDLILFFNTLLRNKFLIGKFTLVFFLISITISLLMRSIWQGTFEIVINKNQPQNSLTSAINNIGIPNLPLNIQSRNLSTELGILKTELLLKPVFDFVYAEKKKKNPNMDDISFRGWRKESVELAVQKKTSIVNFYYKDTDKDLILPVLKKVAERYQIHSNKKMNREIQLMKKYLFDQIKIYKLRSANSMRKVQEYAIDQDLEIAVSTNPISSNNLNINSLNSIPFNLNDSNFLRKSSSSNTFLKQNVAIEEKRVKAANKIKNISMQIEKIKLFADDAKQLQYIGSTIPALVSQGLPRKLENIETQLVEKRSKYTDNDPDIKLLLDKRKRLIKLIKQRSIGYLEAEKLATELEMKAAMRPKEVILEYKELVRDAARDEKTLIDLENKLNDVNLEGSKLNDPWEITSEPFVFYYPVFPNRNRFAIFGVLVGLISGAGYSVFKERKSGIIFEEKIIEKLLGAKVLDKFDINKLTLKYYSKEIFLSEIMNINKFNNVRFFWSSNNVSKEQISMFRNFIENDKKVKFQENLEDINNEEIILIMNLDSVKRKDIDLINQRLLRLNQKLYGILLLEY